MTHPPSPRPNYSPERRATALSWLRAELSPEDLSDDAMVLAAIGLLICNEEGRMRTADLEAAYRDPSIVQAAQTLLEEARA